jgi:hypothetical protein
MTQNPLLAREILRVCEAMPSGGDRLRLLYQCYRDCRRAQEGEAIRDSLRRALQGIAAAHSGIPASASQVYELLLGSDSELADILFGMLDESCDPRAVPYLTMLTLGRTNPVKQPRREHARRLLKSACAQDCAQAFQLPAPLHNVSFRVKQFVSTTRAALIWATYED